MREKLIQLIDDIVEEKECLSAEYIADAIIEFINEQNQIQFAIQQFTGFIEAENSSNIVRLVEAMGLTEEEWLIIRKDEIVNRYSIIEELDEYFNIQK